MIALDDLRPELPVEVKVRGKWIPGWVEEGKLVRGRVFVTVDYPDGRTERLNVTLSEMREERRAAQE